MSRACEFTARLTFERGSLTVAYFLVNARDGFAANLAFRRARTAAVRMLTTGEQSNEPADGGAEED